MTLKPALSSVERAESSSWLVTSGTVDSFGPFETLSWIVEPFGALPLGLWSTTMPFAWSLSTSLRDTVKPWFCSARFAWSNGRPTTEGTVTLAGPLETLMRTLLPFSTTLPAGGSCAVTVPVGLLDGTSKACGSRPALASVVSAASRERPTTLGTSTVSFPFETVIWTFVCFATWSPAWGLWSMTVPFWTESLNSRPTCGTRPAPRILSTASCSVSCFTKGTATGLLASSWSWIFV